MTIATASRSSNITRVPVETLTTPFDGATVYVSRWRVVDPDSKSASFRKGSALCNHSREVVEHVIETAHPGCIAYVMPLAFKPDSAALGVPW